MQGSLGPYEKCLVEFSFTPRFIASEVGWTHHQGLPLRRDYSLFVKFMQIGSRSTSALRGWYSTLTGPKQLNCKLCLILRRDFYLSPVLAFIQRLGTPGPVT